MSDTVPAQLIGGEFRAETTQERAQLVNPCTEEVLSFRDLDDAIERANSTPYGLPACAFTASQKKADALSRGLHAGMIGLNTFMIAHAEAQFGGIDHSGMGKGRGKQAINDDQNVKVTHFIAA